MKFNSSKIEAKLKELYNFEDEELIIGLAQIYFDVDAILIKIHSGNIAAALSSIDELKEKFQDSIKLLNLKGLCLINSGQYENAYALLLKLLSVIEQNEEFQEDEKEIEITLHNFIAVAKYLGRPHQDHLMY